MSGCLFANSHVLTHDGWVELEFFEDGDDVWTGTAWAPATKIYRGDDFRVHLYLRDGRVLDCACRHVLSGRVGWAFRDRWIGVADIQDAVEPDPGPGVKLLRDTAKAVPDWGRAVEDIDSWYWAGRMCRSGKMSDDSWEMLFKTDDTRSISALSKWVGAVVRDAPGDHCQVSLDIGSGMLLVHGSTPELMKVWGDLGIVAGEPRLPSCWNRIDGPRRRALLQGSIGSDELGDVSITSSHKDLLIDVVKLVASLGASSNVSRVKDRWLFKMSNDRLKYEHVVMVKHLPDPESTWTLAVKHKDHSFATEGFISKNVSLI